MKIIYSLFLCLMAVAVNGSDIQRAITFQDGATLSAAQLNGLIDNAAITTGFYTTRPSESLLGTADVFLIFSPTLNGYYKVTANQLLYANPAFFTNQTQVTFAATNDLLNIYSTANGSVGSINPINLISNSFAWDFKYSTNQPNTNLVMVGLYGGTIDNNNAISGGTNYGFTLPMIYQEGMQVSTPTNLPVITTPSPTDTFGFWQSSDRINYTFKSTTRIAQFTNSTPINNTVIFTNFTPTLSTGVVFMAAIPQVWGTTNFSYVTNVPTLGVTNIFTNATLSLVSTIVSNATIQTVSLGQIQQWLTNAPLPYFPTSFTSALSATLAAGLATNWSHGMVSTPVSVRCVLVCQTAENGYSIGDELDAQDFKNNLNQRMINYGANSTNVFFVVNSSVAGTILNKTTGSDASTTIGNYKIRIYANLNP